MAFRIVPAQVIEYTLLYINHNYYTLIFEEICTIGGLTAKSYLFKATFGWTY